MSTRGNVVIKGITEGSGEELSFYYEIPSSAYPEEVVPQLLKYDGTPESLIDSYVSPGNVGNADYFYEINATDGTLKVWDSQVFWVSAPANWKERGYHCWKGNDGRYGFSSWRKGKRLDIGRFVSKDETPYRGLIKLYRNDKYTRKNLSLITADTKDIWHLGNYMKKLRYDPDKIFTWLSACPDYIETMYKEPLEDMALMVNYNYLVDKAIANWRLKIAV